MFSQHRWIPCSHLSPPALVPQQKPAALRIPLPCLHTDSTMVSITLLPKQFMGESALYTYQSLWLMLWSQLDQFSVFLGNTNPSSGCENCADRSRPDLSGSCRTFSISLSSAGPPHESTVGGAGGGDSQAQGNGNVGKTPGFLSGWVTLSPHPHSVQWMEKLFCLA